jgi:hypothetical protein
MTVSATWGARCGKSARRVLRGGTGTRGHAGSVRPLPRKGQLRQGSAKATAPRPVPTSHAIDHGWVVQFVEHRIADQRVVRLIQKWLNAGVLEEGKRTRAEQGTPQGGSASPLLANIYLHYVFDLWVHAWRRKHAGGDVIVVRYADDIVLGFQVKSDAERFWTELAERFRKFRLELHPEKTRLLEFGPYAGENRTRRGHGKPETFNFSASRTSAGRRGAMAVSRCCGTRFVSGCRPS